MNQEQDALNLLHISANIPIILSALTRDETLTAVPK
jgi:hypothetical protein